MDNKILIRRIYISLIVFLFLIVACYFIIYSYQKSKILTIDSIENEEVVKLLSDYYESIQNKDIESLENLIDLYDFNELIEYENTEEDLEKILERLIEEEYYIDINKVEVIDYDIEDDGNILIFYSYKNKITYAYINSEYKIICEYSLYSEYKEYHTLKYLDENDL